MKLLLDTHTFLWFVNNDASLSQNARNFIEDANSQVFLSIASVWEIAIKMNLGKLRVPGPLHTFIEAQVKLNEIEMLAINLDHTHIVSFIPLHHRDPFDRMLIAQSLNETMPIVSAETAFDTYPSVARLW